MKPERQQQVMAELDGWREAFPGPERQHPLTQEGGILLPYRWVNERTHARCYDLPDYLHDLNVLRNIAINLIYSKRLAYKQNLQLIMSRNLTSGGIIHIIECIDASAPDRLEAILRALNRWEED